MTATASTTLDGLRPTPADSLRGIRYPHREGLRCTARVENAIAYAPQRWRGVLNAARLPELSHARPRRGTRPQACDRGGAARHRRVRRPDPFALRPSLAARSLRGDRQGGRVPDPRLQPGRRLAEVR